MMSSICRVPGRELKTDYSVALSTPASEAPQAKELRRFSLLAQA